MRCQFCTQWNPDEAAACAFCGNDLRCALDATAEGRPVYESMPANVSAAVERQAAALAQARHRDPDQRASDRAVSRFLGLFGQGQRSIGMTLAMVLLVYLIYKLSQC